MPTIADIRAQYPQYSDMSDAALTDALYKKFYSDLPRAEFDAKLGVSTSGIPGPRSFLSQAAQQIGNVAAGAVRGAGSIGATLIRPFETAEENVARRQAIDAALQSMGAEPESLAYGAGKVGAEIAGTLPIGGVIAKPVAALATRIPALTPLATAIESSGFTAGPGVRAMPALAARALGGAATGAGAAALISPEETSTGAGLGAGMALAAPPVIGGIARGAGFVKDALWGQVPQLKAALIARNALGPDLPAVLNILKEAQGKGVSAAQATADINSPTWQALIQRATARDPRFLEALRKAQGEVSTNALVRLAGGETATDVRAANELAKQTLTDITSPARQAALARANQGQQIAALEARSAQDIEAAANEVEKVRRLEVVKEEKLPKLQAKLSTERFPGEPRVPFRYTYQGELANKAEEWASKAAEASLDLGQGARFSQSAADSLREAGIAPLEAIPLISSLRGITRDPAFAGNDVMRASVDNLTRDLAEWTTKGGVIDAVALDAIRKNSVNAAVRDLLKGQDPTVQREAAASVMTRIKPMLVDAIEAAGGTGYRAYLEEYAKGMQEIAKQKLTGEALNLWKTNKDAFVRLVQGESPEVVEKFLGKGNYDIATELADNTLQVLRSQAQKHLANLAVEKQATAGKDALKDLLLDNLSKWRFPSYLSAVAATTNKALDILERKIGVKTMATLTEGLKTPGGAVSLLEKLPTAERNRVLSLLSNPAQWKAYGSTAARGGVAEELNALAPEQTNQNALAR